MFLSPIDAQRFPGKRAWENFTFFADGRFHAFFATGTPDGSDTWGSPNKIDIAVSDDGVRWRFIARDILRIPGAHAGFGVVRIGDRTMYYPTCSNHGKDVHFKVFASRDLLSWEHLGDRFDVRPDYRYYHGRWDELCVLHEQEDGGDVYYGYISSEVREDVGAPSVGMMKSRDGVVWEVLPPPVIEWGELPAQHMELNFCEKIDGRWYLSMSGRFYLDSYGYSLFTFVGDSPLGPFRPDREMFRLAGTSRRSVTWLGHTIQTPDGLLLALWLSVRQLHDLPSNTFGIGPLKRLCCENGHLRLRWWEGNESAKGPTVPIEAGMLQWVHPAPAARTGRDTMRSGPDGVELSASRDGALVMLDHRFDAAKGFVIEGRLEVRAGQGHVPSHRHAAAAGFFFEGTPGRGCAVIPDTLGVTRIGSIAFADHRITEEDCYRNAGASLVASRSGELRGTCAFTCEDTVGPFGHASYCGVRHGQSHRFRLIARGDYFEFYIDDYYVQTFVLPIPFTGRMGLLAFDGIARFEGVAAWDIAL